MPLSCADATKGIEETSPAGECSSYTAFSRLFKTTKQLSQRTQEQFTQRQDDTKSGKFTSIYSLPFYTHRYGYKMCLRLYPFGDGAGRETHLSLFIVVMKGDFDEILEWPFKHKMTFQLLNQNGSKDVADAFRADPQSSSFRKPISDMNIATGCPKFAPLDDLQKQGFASGNLLFVRAQMEPFTGSKLSTVSRQEGM